MPRNNGEMRSWARLGAQQRLQQLERERQMILRAFPELGRSARGRQSADGRTSGGRRRKRRRMSAAERKAISQRMKKLWAERRKQAK